MTDTKQRIHFGSLEGRLADTPQPIEEDNNVESHPSSSGLKMRVTQQQAILDDLEKKKIKHTVKVPTDDFAVRTALRDLGLPVTYFGEGASERRHRLKDIVAERFSSNNHRLMAGEDLSFLFDEEIVQEDDRNEEFYSYGPPELEKCRKDILQYSIPKAIQRKQLHEQELTIPFAQRKKLRHGFYTALQFGDDRPMGFCKFSPNSKLLATSSWSGLVKMWNVPESELVASFKGHRDRVSGIDFHPKATVSQSPTSLNFVSGSTDGSVHLWSLNDEEPIGSLVGHEMRVARVAFHPSGRWVGTASFDTSWRLWDAETTQELLIQEGHSREVFCIGFQGDGALCATAGLDSVGRIWDLRTGRSIMALRSHIKPILALDWSPNGYQLATAGEDNTIRIWDIRSSACVYQVPAHTSLITSVRYWHATDAFDSNVFDDWTFEGRNLHSSNSGMDVDDGSVSQEVNRKAQLDGSFLLSSSYDGTCKLWTDGDFKPLGSLSGVEGKVMSADISGDAKHVVTALYDRTFKLYHSPKV